ncbi:unnamed protein product [Macrosiphum euphorbiae]|uniref:Uncharacterized protein n=1 Tax=Macrosiphum euphorbiae TaxID=13131 RepID=A0AAV0XHY3_9HEMI|nr:unnamed protein product [Macrosiphum euphorbiae]
MLMLTLTSSGAAADNDVSAGENLFELDTLNTQCHRPTSPTTSTSFTSVAGPPPAVNSEHFWPPTPPPTVTSENFWLPAPPPALTSENFWPPPPPPAVTSEHFLLPPPPPAVTSEHFLLPPPPPTVTSKIFWPMTTGTAAFRRDPVVQEPCASVRGTEEKELPTYCRVPITVESLRAVVLKPVARQT